MERNDGVLEENGKGRRDEEKTWRTFVNEHEGEVVARREFLVDFAESRGQVEAAEEEADGYRFAAGGRAIHYLPQLCQYKPVKAETEEVGKGEGEGPLEQQRKTDLKPH